MTVSTSEARPTPFARGCAQRPKGLLFRVCGGEHDGRRVRLLGARCTVGSAPDCSLRLVASEIHPVHCLLIRGHRGTIVRSWSPDTHLNGRPFHDSWLREGDRLRIGPVEFELLAAGSIEDRLPAPRDATSDPAAESTPVEMPVEMHVEVHPSTADAERQFEQHLRQLLEQRQETARLEEELEVQRAEFAAERRQWSEERQQVLDELDTRETCLRSLYAEIERERESLARDHQTPDATRHAHRRRSDVEADQEPAPDCEHSSETQCAPSLLEPAAEPLPASDGPDEDCIESDAAGDSVLGADNQIESATEHITEPHRESDEFSIEVYMSQLLQRVGGKPKAAAPAAESPARVLPRPVPERSTASPATNTPRAPVSPATPAAGLLPRAKPLSLDLHALRDVANQTARSAIGRHTSRIGLQAAAGKWFGAAVALIAAIGLIYWSTQYSVRSSVGIVMAGLVAVFWMGQAIWLTHRAIRTRLAERSDIQGSQHPAPK